MLFWEKIAENKIQEAAERGEFENLEGAGKPIDLEAYFKMPASVRAGYDLLYQNNVVPKPILLKKEIESLRAQRDSISDPSERHKLQKQIAEKTIQVDLLLMRNNRP